MTKRAINGEQFGSEADFGWRHRANVHLRHCLLQSIKRGNAPTTLCQIATIGASGPTGQSKLRGSRDIYFPMNTSLQHSCGLATKPIAVHSLRQTLHLHAGQPQRANIGLSHAQPTVRISFRKHSKHLIPAPSVPSDATFVRHNYTDRSTDGGAQLNTAT